MSSIPRRTIGHRRLRGLAVAACVLVWLAAAPGPIAVFMSSFTFGSNARTAEARVGMTLLGGGLLTLYLGCAAAGVVVIMWLWRARAAAAAWGDVPLRWSQGWVIAGWFVPVANLVIPMLVVSDVVRVITDGPAAARSARLGRIVPLWWMGWIGGWVALWVASSLLPTIAPGNVASVYLFFALFSGVSALLFVGSAAAFTHIALQVSALGDERFGRRAAQGGAGAAPTLGVPSGSTMVIANAAVTANVDRPHALPRPVVPDTGSPLPGAPRQTSAPGHSGPLGPAVPGPVNGPHVPPPPPRTSSGGSAWVPLLIIAGAVLVGAPTLAVAVRGDEPRDVLAVVVDDVRGWNGANYRGTVVAPDGGSTDVDVTVTAAGAKGTLSRDGGRARAEIVQDRAGILLKGNQEWWRHRHPDRAEQLADSWVADPMTETMVIDPILELDPAGLSSRLRPEGRSWKQIGEQYVDGQRGMRISDGSLQLIVTADEPHRLLVIDVQPGGSARAQSVRVTVVLPAQAAEVDRAAARIRSSESPRSLVQRLLERPRADVQLRSEPMCRTATCTVTATVVNTGELTFVGRIEISADGVLAATYPVHLRPGQTATFTARTANVLYNRPGATGQILWKAAVRNQ
jgi:hypothetical protein